MLNKFKYLVIVLFTFFLLMIFPVIQDARSVVMTSYVTYWADTSETVTVQWDAVPTATEYDVNLIWIRGDYIVQVYTQGHVIEPQIVCAAPRVGYFLVEVRAYNANNGLYSGWACSNNVLYATVNGEANAWGLEFYMAPPSDIIIN